MRVHWSVMALLVLAGCTPEEDMLRDHVPTFFQIASVESTDYHPLNCFRATYRVHPPTDGRFDLSSWSKDGLTEYQNWQRIEQMGSSSFLRCVDAAEQALWQPSIDAGQAVETGDANDRNLRIWYDPIRQRLLVLVYQN